MSENEDKYVPQVGDVVSSGGNGISAGIYLGEQSGRGSGRHVVLGEDGKSCTIVGYVGRPDSALLMSGGSYPYEKSLAEEAARLLAQICESLEVPQTIAQTQTYRTPAASAFAMTSEMAAWWAKARPRMAKVCFVDSWLKIKAAREKVAAIERLDGTPSIEAQERVDSAEFELAARRARVLCVFADQIAAMRSEHKIFDSPAPF